MRIVVLAIFIFALSAAAFGQTTVAREKQAAAELKSLLNLRAKLEKIPFNSEKNEPHKSFLKSNERRIAYNEPAGQWVVRSELFWELREKYSDLAIADEIAWEAAQNPVPGECEGYMNCGVYFSQITSVRYLSYYPQGKHSKAALTDLKDWYASYADPTQAGTSYSPPEDVSDKAELQRMLKEIDGVLAKVPGADSAAIREYIKTIAGRYK